jgi:copper chaperone CopZ
MPTLKLYVRNLTMADEERRIAQTVRSLAGVYAVVANCEGHCLEVDFEDDDVSVAEIVDAIAAAGFEAHLAS